MRFGFGKLARGAATSASGLAARAVLQAAYLVAVSRWLGVENYGLFAGALSVAVILAPLSGWGAGFVYMEYVTRRPGLIQPLWSRIAYQALGSGIGIGLVAVVILTMILDEEIPLAAVCWIAAAELVLLPLAQICSTALLAIQRPGFAALSVCAVPAARVLGVISMIAFGYAPSLNGIAFSHGMGSAIAAAAVVMGVRALVQGRTTDEVPGSLPDRRRIFIEGMPYAWIALLSLGYLEIDKILVLKCVGPAAAGTYTAAFRVVSVLFIPVTALLSNALPRLLMARAAGSPTPLLSHAVIVAVGYTLFAAVLAWGVAPFVPQVFGPGFAETTPILMQLAAWLPLAAVHQCGATALTAIGGKYLRMWIEALGFAVVVGLNLVLLPRIGTVGAVFALVSAESLMALGCWWAYRHARRHAPARLEQAG